MANESPVILKMTTPLLLWAELLLMMLSISSRWCTTTDITWHANAEDGGTTDPAKTAPKSQKYWDEHKIVKPDYAYTDAEYRAMKNVDNVTVVSNGIAWSVATCFVLGMAAGLYVLHVSRGPTTGGGGAVLGSSSSGPVEGFVNWLRSAVNSPPSHDADAHEKARQARLARFQQSPAAAEKSD